MTSIQRFLIASSLVLAVTTWSAADTKDYPKLIVGKWKVVKADQGTVPEGGVFEFAPDGKLKLQIAADRNDLLLDGTYRMEGAKLTITVKVGNDDGRTKSLEIQRLDQTNLKLVDSDQKAVELRRS